MPQGVIRSEVESGCLSCWSITDPP